jgi:hypothetical protein
VCGGDVARAGGVEGPGGRQIGGGITHEKGS